ncbi:MAG: DUF1460 domain-containing protein [Gemmatimonas sp.]|nr:DUF1460 domain-containing protein [Gemmatimonas sp.]
MDLWISICAGVMSLPSLLAICWAYSCLCSWERDVLTPSHWPPSAAAGDGRRIKSATVANDRMKGARTLSVVFVIIVCLSESRCSWCTHCFFAGCQTHAIGDTGVTSRGRSVRRRRVQNAAPRAWPEPMRRGNRGAISAIVTCYEIDLEGSRSEHPVLEEYMIRQYINAITISTLMAVTGLALASCNGSDNLGGSGASPDALEVATKEAGAGAGPAAPPPPNTDEARTLQADREIFEATMERARQEGLASLPIGERIATLGKWFVGADYVPGTLEVTPEHLVVNLREFDCVTYVESMLAMARLLDRPTQTFEAFQDELRAIRYRGGVLDGYVSRLHYFSDWILDNERLGILDDVTRELGGIPLDEPIDFMTTHRESYPALQSPEFLERIREHEVALSEQPIYYIPEARVAEIAPHIQDGDIIAATSSVSGLDVAHTGIAVRIHGALHLMHAPLVGKSVEISELPLAERILGIDGQDGIMVARAVSPRA